jgi:hypothetical protein
MTSTKSKAMLEQRQRVLLDTNVWRYVVDAHRQGDLIRAARNGRYEVQIAPGVLYETLRSNDKLLMRSIVGLQTKACFKRLMPEAYSETAEILAAIRNHRPDWLRPDPDLTFYDRLRKDWSRKMGGFWVRCETSPDQEASFIRRSEGDTIQNSREETKARREEMRASDWKSNPPMDKTLGSLPSPAPGWDGNPVPAWRLETWNGLAFNLRQVGNPYRDWLCPFVDFDHGLLRSAAWTEFWLHLIEPTEVPRQWLRWAHAFAQRFRKVSPGSGGDTQLFSYFPDTDMIVTADKALLDVLEECRPYAPIRLPKAQLLAAGGQGVEQLMSLLVP